MRRVAFPSLVLAAVAIAAFAGAAGADEELPTEMPTLGSEIPALDLPKPIPLPPIDCESPLRLPLIDCAPVDGVIALPLVDSAAANNRLTLAEVEAMALAYHPALRQAEGRINAARGNWVQVGLRPNPVIGYQGNQIGDNGTAGQQGGFVSQEFVTAGKLGLNRAVANREQAAAEQRLEIARLQVLTTTRIYYFENLAAERTVVLSRQLSEVAAQALKASELRLKALDIPRSSLLQSQIESESVAQLEQQANARREAAWRRLATAIGLEDKPPTRLEDALARPLPELNWAGTRQSVLTQNPELSELHYEVERAKLAVERARAGRVPNVTIMAGVAHDNSTKDEIANVQASLPLPLFDRNQGARAQACGELIAAQAAYENKKLALEQQLAAAMRDYETARQRVNRYTDKILPVARESLEIISSGYKAGELEYIQALNAQQTFAEKNLLYLQDLETAWTKWAEIEGLMVGPLPDSTSDPAGMPLVR